MTNDEYRILFIVVFTQNILLLALSGLIISIEALKEIEESQFPIRGMLIIFPPLLGAVFLTSWLWKFFNPPKKEVLSV